MFHYSTDTNNKNNNNKSTEMVEEYWEESGNVGG